MDTMDTKYFLLISLFIITLSMSRPSSTTMAITGGHDTHIRDAPYQLSLRLDGRHICGAVLIAQNAAVTAASCLPTNTMAINYTIVAGQSDKTLHYRRNLGFKVKKFHLHPLYSPITYQHDIAYLEIDPMTIINGRVQIIKMDGDNSSLTTPSSSVVRTQNVQLTPDTKFKVNGWGSTRWGDRRLAHQLQSATVTFVPNDQCQTLYDQKSDRPNHIFKTMLCAGNVQSGGQDACMGDGGGPLVLPGDDAQNHILIGLNSWGHKCGMANFPGVYTRIRPHVQWIECLQRRQNGENERQHINLKKASRRRTRIAQPARGTKVVQGNDTRIDHLPYQLSLRHNGRHLCGAVLITQTAALTAAHCFDDYDPENLDDFTIVGGEGDMTLHNDSSLVVGVTRIHIHDHYDMVKVVHDIAYLEIEPMVLTAFVNIIQINGQNLSSTTNTNETVGLSPGTNLTVSGWGKYGECDPLFVGYLQSARVPLVSNEQCQTLYNEKLTKPNKIMDSMLCAGHVGIEGSDSCQGDSGGPLVLPSHYVEDDLLIGLVSWAHGCGRSSFPGVYTRISSYLDWIMEMIRNSSSQTSFTTTMEVDKSKFVCRCDKI